MAVDAIEGAVSTPERLVFNVDAKEGALSERLVNGFAQIIISL